MLRDLCGPPGRSSRQLRSVGSQEAEKSRHLVSAEQLFISFHIYLQMLCKCFIYLYLYLFIMFSCQVYAEPELRQHKYVLFRQGLLLARVLNASGDDRPSVMRTEDAAALLDFNIMQYLKGFNIF